MQHRLIIARQYGDQILPQLLQIREAVPGDLRFERLPDPLAGVDLRRIRRLKKQHHVLRDAQVLALVALRIVQQQHIQRV